MIDANEGASADGSGSDIEENTRPQRGGEAATTRFGMEDGDNTDRPATGLDGEPAGSTKSQPSDADAADAEDEAAKLGDFA